MTWWRYDSTDAPCPEIIQRSYKTDWAVCAYRQTTIIAFEPRATPLREGGRGRRGGRMALQYFSFQDVAPHMPAPSFLFQSTANVVTTDQAQLLMSPFRHHLGRASNGQVAVSALGSGGACPTAVIAFCPSRRCTALSQYEVCCRVQPSSLRPLSILALWALQGYAYILVKGHSLPVLL